MEQARGRITAIHEDRITVEVDLLGLGYRSKHAIDGGIGSGAGGADDLGLLEGFLTPGAGDEVVGALAGTEQVQGHHGELQAGASLQQQDLVVVT